MANQFNNLDAQNEMHRLAQVGPMEQDTHEFDAWQAESAQARLQDRTDEKLAALLAQGNHD